MRVWLPKKIRGALKQNSNGEKKDIAQTMAEGRCPEKVERKKESGGYVHLSD